MKSHTKKYLTILCMVQLFFVPNRIPSLLNTAITKNIIVWLSLFLFMDSYHVSCSPFLLALFIDMLFMINLSETNNELQQKFQNTNLCLSMLNTIMLM